MPVPSSSIKGGTFAIPNGADSVTLTGCEFLTLPISITVTVLKPDAMASNIAGTIRGGSITLDGFIVDLTGPVGTIGYVLNWLAILTPSVTPTSPVDVSPTTGEIFYSFSWLRVKELLRTMNIGESRMALVNETMVNNFQEFVDRDMDAILSEVYEVPLRAMNAARPYDGVVIRVFPGDVHRAALYWTAGTILLSEFQGLESNITQQAEQMINDAKMQVFNMTKPSHRVPGVRRKSNVSKTMPPQLQPSFYPERPS